MARSDEQVLRDLIVSDMMYWRKHGDGKLLHDPKCATIIGKMLAVQDNCAKLQEIWDRKLAVKRNQEE